MSKFNRGDVPVSGRGRVRVRTPSTPPRTNASRPVRRARLSAGPKVERSAWMEIEGLLAAGHRRLQQQFAKAAKLSSRDSENLVEAGQRLVTALRSHFDLKTGSVYPVLYDTLPDTGVILEAEIEIELARALIDRLDALEPFDERYQPTMNILGAWLDRHLEQERTRLFAAARRAQPPFARRMPEVRARFALDAAVLTDMPGAGTAANGAAVQGTAGPTSKRVRRGGSALARRALTGASAAALLN